MRIFFSAPIGGRSQFEANYKRIINCLVQKGHKVQSDHVTNVNPKKLADVSDKYRVDYYKKLVKWISEADIVVAELSHSSASIGHEVSLALEKGKNVIALSSTNRGPAIFLGIKSDKLQMIKYDLNNLEGVLGKAIEKAKSKSDIRFNFFISPQINDYLDWISKEKRVPRAVYLRELLEKEIANNREFQEEKSES